MGADFAALNARVRASLASRARSSAGLLPRGPSNVNTGTSPRRTTAEAELGKADALAAGAAEALGGGGAGAEAALAGGALGGGAGAGGRTAAGDGTGAAGSGSRSAAGGGSGAGGAAGAGAAGAEEEAAGDAEVRATGAAVDRGRTETDGAKGAEGAEGAAEALLAVDSARAHRGPNRATAKLSAMGRNQSPHTRTDVDERADDLTLGRAASVTGLATAS